MTYDSTCNGRAAWLSLIAHFEGESYHNHNLEYSYNPRSITFWRLMEGIQPTQLLYAVGDVVDKKDNLILVIL
jgi:hypothetical protein